MSNIIKQTSVFVLLFCLSQAGYSEPSLLDIQKRWASINYEMTGKQQLEAFEVLDADIKQYLQGHAEDAGLWIWSGINKSTLAGAKGGLGALSIAKAAKADLEKALELDAQALEGSAYTSLGTLYHKVPGWPIGFGSDETAEDMLLKALSINPDGIDPNYFYGELLFDRGKYEEAQRYLNKAISAPPRPDRPLADKGRQQEIMLLLEKNQEKLKNKSNAFALDRR